jgi:hypothetical protein
MGTASRRAARREGWCAHQLLLGIERSLAPVDDTVDVAASCSRPVWMDGRLKLRLSLLLQLREVSNEGLRLPWFSGAWENA